MENVLEWRDFRHFDVYHDLLVLSPRSTRLDKLLELGAGIHTFVKMKKKIQTGASRILSLNETRQASHYCRYLYVNGPNITNGTFIFSQCLIYRAIKINRDDLDYPEYIVLMF